MATTIKITPIELTIAQMDGEVMLNTTGLELCAEPLRDGTWKYILSFGGMVGHIVYAPPGLEAAMDALNAAYEAADATFESHPSSPTP